jgi:acetylornithine deacetylase/succinyl-diaminopimelate desuccinylase-like protein
MIMSNLPALIQYTQQNQQRYLDELNDLLRIPSISTQAERTADVARAADWVADSLRDAGMENIEIISTQRHPLIYADWLHAGDSAPTVLFYGHYDVQPPEPLELWNSPPFEPVIVDGYLVARGSSDDKGQMFIHIKAVEAYLKNAGTLPVNVKFIIEGEEEDGGESLEAYVPLHGDKLAADVALVSDTHILSADQPSIVYGLRGMCYMLLDLTGPAIDLHSGSYGGGINNPLNALGHVIANLKDQDGHILIPGFYDKVRTLDVEERAMLAQLPFNEAKWLADTGATEVWGEPEYTLLERLGARPTLDVHGIIGGYTGAGGKTVLPAKVHAKISMRLVPDQDPEEIRQLFEDHVKSILPPSIGVKCKYHSGAKASVTNYKMPAMKAAHHAYTVTFGKEPVMTREGGSIPVVGLFQEHLGIETILMGFGLPGDRIHSPNERFYLANFYKGIDTVIHFLAKYGEK